MKAFERWLVLVLCAALALQLFFVLRIVLAAWWDPQSTSLQRSEMWRIWHQSSQQRPWQQQWVDYARISPHLKRAVLTAEDDGFVEHDGVQWEAIERAWERNQQALERAQAKPNAKPPKIYGGSTITQQLAKNLLLSGERSFLRKGQELLLARTLEVFLSKQRILEIYLNNVEWGQGIFGAEAAARHYFRKSAAQLSATEAARLAVMLPRPRYYELNPQSRYLQSRTNAIARRMAAAPLP
ncbi:monofunctional biosynthetic peptidoglycan transglycosylase [Comamonas sp.]|uniref:monofunctional biosynthetic peptidoglycan transglycosylase n=1 Tax=Comamonas sp. TaxID=34028 RepID=UPI0028967E04|nr:monofunctional biosynthetic peptidoglycan transglycosylase [Comamonas sp.]